MAPRAWRQRYYRSFGDAPRPLRSSLPGRRGAGGLMTFHDMPRPLLAEADGRRWRDAAGRRFGEAGGERRGAADHDIA